jgi:hypothetical protein
VLQECYKSVANGNHVRVKAEEQDNADNQSSRIVTYEHNGSELVLIIVTNLLQI